MRLATTLLLNFCYANRSLKTISQLLVFIFLSAQLNAADTNSIEKQAKEIAQISSRFVHTLDKKQLNSTLKTFITDNKDIIALRIIKDFENKPLFSFYKKKSLVFYNKEIPKNFTYQLKIIEPIFFKEKKTI